MFCHAPRERVSWNHVYISVFPYFCSHAPRERVSWNFSYGLRLTLWCCHAPRERVSWNAFYSLCNFLVMVTLHVSVWVEITNKIFKVATWQSRSTWACELKLDCKCSLLSDLRSRSTWACELKLFVLQLLVVALQVTLHVSVWVEISCYTF